MLGSRLLFWAVLLAVGLVVAERIFVRSGRGRVLSWPVFARPVLSDAERAFYARLRVAVPEFLILCQVQIGQFVEVKDVARRYEVRNRYDRLCADFVVCAEDFRALLVIELDDATHDRALQRARDSKKDAVLTAAGIPVIRFRGSVSVDRIRKDVLSALHRVDQTSACIEKTAASGRKLPYIGSL